MELPECVSKLVGFLHEKFTEQDLESYGKLPEEIRNKLESGNPQSVKEGLEYTMRKNVKLGWAAREFIQEIIETTRIS